MIRAGLAALLVLGWVLPGERVVEQLASVREKQQPLRVEARLLGDDPERPQHVRFELHPELGFRVSDEQGGRWIVRGGRVVAASDQKVPQWIPAALEILVLNRDGLLRAWLEWARIDVRVNQFGRCGESDCFVVGGRAAARQLWVEKDRFEIERWVAARGSGIQFEAWRDWGRGLRFPARIRVLERDAVHAEFEIERVISDPDLSEADFVPAWVREAAANPLDP